MTLEQFNAENIGNKSRAIEIAKNESAELANRIEKESLPSADYFRCFNSKGEYYMSAPGFTVDVLLDRARHEDSFVRAMTTLSNDNTEKTEDSI